jgi:diguanylate cyclase (GGDEF)-like protein
MVCARPLESAENGVTHLQQQIDALRREVALLRITNAELERVVIRDTLTPLYNRRFFITALNERISRASRYDARAIAIIVDVDHMKRINDANGHPAGDFVLMYLADILARSIRTSDVAARIGGDEFALILDEMDMQQASRKIAALEMQIAETPCRFGHTELDVSAAFGCTDIRAGDSDATIMARADDAMYAQKRRRRDGAR